MSDKYKKFYNAFEKADKEIRIKLSTIHDNKDLQIMFIKQDIKRIEELLEKTEKELEIAKFRKRNNFTVHTRNQYQILLNRLEWCVKYLDELREKVLNEM